MELRVSKAREPNAEVTWVKHWEDGDVECRTGKELERALGLVEGDGKIMWQGMYERVPPSGTLLLALEEWSRNSGMTLAVYLA